MDEIAVRQIRAALGMSIEQFALAIGVSKTSVKNWEAGLSKPNQANLLKMLREMAALIRRMEKAKS